MRGTRIKIECLPDDVLLFIFRYLDGKQLEEVAKVCQKWRKIAFDTSLWKAAEFINCKEGRVLRWLEQRTGSQLKEIDLYKSSISPRLLATIASACPKIEKLLLKHCYLYLQQLFFEIKTYKALKILDIRDLQGHTCYFDHFLKHVPNVELFAFDNSIARYWKPKVFTKMQNLRVLECSGCFDVQNEDMLILAESCSKLESVAMNGCYKVDGIYLPLLLQNCPQLKALSLAKTRITDASLRECSWSQSQITEINFSDCPISSWGLRGVLRVLPDVKYLSLKDSGKNITIDEILLGCIAEFRSLRALNIDTSFADRMREILVCRALCECQFITYLNIGNGIKSIKRLKVCLKSLPLLRSFSFTHTRRYLRGYDYTGTHDSISVENVINNLTKYCHELEVLGLCEFPDEQKRRKRNAFCRLFKNSNNFKKLYLCMCSRDVVIMALDARLLAKREKLEIVQPGMITPSPRVYLPPQRMSFDALVYGVGITNQYSRRKFVLW